MIELHYVHTPNVMKISIMLHEVALPFERIYYDVFKGEHLTPSFRSLNLNNKLPVIRDLEPSDGGEPHIVFESGAILHYLAEKTGSLGGKTLREKSEVLQWLMWQMSGLGPMGGQAAHFLRYAPADETYSRDRYTREFTRLLNVLESRLSEAKFLAGTYSIADIAAWPLVNIFAGVGFDPADFPALAAWRNEIGGRPAVLRASSTEGLPNHLLNPRTTLTPNEWSNVYGDKQFAAASPSNRI